MKNGVVLLSPQTKKGLPPLKNRGRLFFHVGALHGGTACLLSIELGPRWSVSLLYFFMVGQKRSDHTWTCDLTSAYQILHTRNLTLELYLLGVICSPQ